MRRSCMRVVRWSSLLAVLAIGVACGEPIPSSKPASSAQANAPAPKAPRTRGPDAKAMFESLCFTCHGSTGHGDGPGAGALNPKPRSFADAAWQDSVTDEHIKKAVVFGGAAVGKSAMMPAQPQLKGNDAILDGLVTIVRGFKGNPQATNKQ